MYVFLVLFTIILIFTMKKFISKNCKNIYSNKKETSDFHGTVSFDTVKMAQQKIKPKCLSNVGHTKIGNYFIFIFLS